jgi:enamine deaminase RidA (YjgF/YER057c/UK114 family)
MSAENSKATVSFVTVPEWPRPKGYANGTIGQGRVLHIAGQIATDADGDLQSEDGVVVEFAQALDNVLAVLRAAGGQPHHIASMTVYVTDADAYYRSGEGLGQVWRERLGKHFPAMAVVGVTRLYESAAHVEIQAVAYLP